jgi:HAMP domain-containing protein
MFFLFVCLPIVITLVAGYVYLRRVEKIKNDYGEQINEVVTQMGESQVAAKTRSTARQLELYFSANPDLAAEDLNRDRAVRRIAVQKIGQTGYTFLYELPGEGNSWNVLVHPNPEVVGSDLTGKRWPRGFQKVIKSTSGGKEANGFYSKPLPSGERKERYMFCAPVGNTGYVVAATVEKDSMIQPAHVLNTQLDKTYLRMRDRTLLVLGGIAAFFLLIVSWFGHRLTKRIQSLTEVAERISVGELEAEVEVKGKDEISTLAEAISRMQESVRLSIERLRRRRS